MTERVNPSPARSADAFQTAGAIALGGGSSNGWIAPAADPTEISTQSTDIDETALNAFAESHSTSSLDVTIDAGEAFVYGSWVAIDTSTTVTLSASTSGQTVYVGWNKGSSDDVIVGLQGAFDSASGDTDQKIPLYDFDTDGSGVTNTSDRREIGQYHDLSHLEVAEELGIPIYSDSANAPQNEGNIIFVDGTGSQASGVYSHDGSSYVKAGNTDEAIQDIVSALLVGGENVSLTYDDAGNALTIDVPQAGAFTDSDSDGIAELLDTFSGIQLGDDEEVQLSTDGDVHIRYDSGVSDVRIGGDTSTGTTSAGTVQSKFASPSSAPQGVGLDSSDCIWHADYSSESIYELNRSGTVQSGFATPSSLPDGVGVDSSGCIWNADNVATSIYEFNHSGTVQSGFATPSGNPQGVGVDSIDCIWHADNDAASIYELNRSGTIQSQFASPSSAPMGVGLDSSDCVWNADYSAGSIYELTQSGTVQSQFASPSSAPQGVGLDSSDCIWHADNDAASIYELNRFSTTDTTDLLALNRDTGDLTIDGELTEGATL